MKSTKQIVIKRLIPIVIIIGMLISLMYLNLTGSTPLFKGLLISPKLGKVIFNNYNLEDTLILANKYLNNGEAKRAYIAYQYILQEQPDNIKVYIALADLYARIKNFKLAKEYIREAEERLSLETEPRIIKHTYYTAGLIYEGAYVYEGYKSQNDAINYYNKALKINLIDEELNNYYFYNIYFHLGIIYSNRENYAQGVYYYEKALKYSNSDNLYYSLGITYIHLKDFQQAYDSIMKYEKTFGKDNSYYLAMSYYYTEIDQLEKAKQFLEKCEETEQDFFKYHLMYGNYYEKIGEFQKAKEHYEKYLYNSIFLYKLKRSERIIEKFAIDIEEIEERNIKEMEKNYNTTIEL